MWKVKKQKIPVYTPIDQAICENCKYFKTGAKYGISLQFEKPSLRKEKRRLKDVAAVYLNKQFRLLFKTYERGEEPHIIVVCELSDISKHYEK